MSSFSGSGRSEGEKAGKTFEEKNIAKKKVFLGKSMLTKLAMVRRKGVGSKSLARPNHAEAPWIVSLKGSSQPSYRTERQSEQLVQRMAHYREWRLFGGGPPCFF